MRWPVLEYQTTQRGMLPGWPDCVTHMSGYTNRDTFGGVACAEPLRTVGTSVENDWETGDHSGYSGKYIRDRNEGHFLRELG